MMLTLDATDTAPLAVQIATGIRRAIAAGEVAVGERLPGARDLAAGLDVHTNTVLAAYRQLRDEGLVELRRGRGATITAAGASADMLPGPVRAATAELLAVAERHGVSRRAIIDLLEARP